MGVVITKVIVLDCDMKCGGYYSCVLLKMSFCFRCKMAGFMSPALIEEEKFFWPIS